MPDRFYTPLKVRLLLMSYSDFAYGNALEAVEIKADLDVAVSHLPEPEAWVVAEVVKGFTLSELQEVRPDAKLMWERAIKAITKELNGG